MNRFACCATAVLSLFVMNGCGGGGGKADVPDVPIVEKGKPVEGPQDLIRKQAAYFGIRQLPPIPEDKKKELRGVNALLQVMLHNPAWVKKVMDPYTQGRFSSLPEFQALTKLVRASQSAYGFEKPHAALMTLDIGALAGDKRRIDMLVELGFAPVARGDIPGALGEGKTFFVQGESGVADFAELPAPERITGLAFEDKKHATAYLKKGNHWIGVNDGGFSKVDMDYLKKLGQGDDQGNITAVSYSEG